MHNLSEKEVVAYSIAWIFTVVACYNLEIFFISLVGFVVSELTIFIVKIVQNYIDMYFKLVEYERTHQNDSNDST